MNRTNIGNMLKLFMVLLMSLMLTIEAKGGEANFKTEMQPQKAISGKCLNYIEKLDCNFYNCLEERFPCGPTGFSLGASLIYCKRSEGFKSHLSMEARQNYVTLRHCLLMSAEIVYKLNSTTCANIAKKLYDAYVPCFYESNICKIGWENRDVYHDVFNIK
ncbi:uncharacterized protein LOC118767942 [Octopus sinensis]|uniref:Uncharacterized protein LOC118767942 n=1 Tax=Octopus sinensis TaxID=2607531 RepID=A0A7E6FNP7_9MOLL|nr:uncharacterized protein LOC118767942 [Octopus sinensis]